MAKIFVTNINCIKETDGASSDEIYFLFLTCSRDPKYRTVSVAAYEIWQDFDSGEQVGGKANKRLLSSNIVPQATMYALVMLEKDFGRDFQGETLVKFRKWFKEEGNLPIAFFPDPKLDIGFLVLGLEAFISNDDMIGQPQLVSGSGSYTVTFKGDGAHYQVSLSVEE